MSISAGKLSGAGTVGPLPAPQRIGAYVASASNYGGSGYIAAKVGASDSFLLVDSGATLSVIPKQLWLDITKGGVELTGHSGDVSAANGGEMGILGKWQTVCQFDSLALVVEFLVADVPSQDILLGFDFLSKYGVVLDFGKNECRIMGKIFPLIVPADMDKPRVVIVPEDTVIPPRSEAIIPGKVEKALGPGLEGMFEPLDSASNQCDIMIARVVCKVQQGILPVRVINVTEEALTLKEGMRVGTLHIDVEVGCKAEPLTGQDGVVPNVQWTADRLMTHFGLHQRGFAPADLTDIYTLLQKNVSVFSTGEGDLGRTHLTLHKIDTGDAQPIKLPPRRVPIHLQQEVSDHLKQMLANNIIQPSHSPWAAPVVLVRKRDGGLRFCVDYRKLNDVTRKDAYPLPRIDDALDSLSKACWFSTLDLASGYWQVELDPEDKHKTAFITRQGLFEFNVLSFGLCNSPSTFQRLMDLVLADLQWTTCLVYLDDIIIFGRTFQEHLGRLDEVLTKLRQANLKVKPAKCSLFAKEVQYLGHIISAKGVKADPSKVEAVRQWPVPKNQTEVRSFVGLASYYRRFIRGFAEIARPLHQLTEKGRRFKWTEVCQTAFEHLKRSLMSSPVLAYPDPQKTFILDTDASDAGIGAVLSQEDEGQERVIAYASRALTKQERKYATTKKELLSMVTFIKHFKHYLLGKEFVLRTDHNSLKWLHNFQGLEGQLARWVEQLASFHYKIVHRPGRGHANADALSRLPAFLPVTSVPPPAFPTPEGKVICAVKSVCPGALSRPEEEEDELVQAQRKDGELQKILALKMEGRAGDQPPEDLQKYAPVWAQLQIQGSRLVRHPPLNSDAANRIQVVVPSSLVPQILSQLHNANTGGHLGVQKLQAKVKDRFYWVGWFGDVKRWCQECVDCGSRKEAGRKPCAPLQSVVTSRPYERVALDILGPLTETPGSNKYIVVIGDYFSKWTEAFPLPNQEASTVAKLLVEQWVCRFGAPRTIHTDQGRNFESNLFREVCQLLNIHKSRTSAYHPQSDGMIERFNRTLLSMLSLFVEENQSNWDVLLPYVMMAYRSSIHSSTGFTPYKVIFGQEIVLPVDVMLSLDNGERFSSAIEYVARLLDTLSTVVEAVKGHQLRASARQKTAYDFRAQGQYYSEGEFVWLRGKAKKRGLCPKLQRRFRGPYKILERLTEVLYRLVPMEGGVETVVHFNRLKPFLSTATEATSQENSVGQMTAGVPPGSPGASPGGIQSQTSLTGSSGGGKEVMVPGAEPGVSSASPAEEPSGGVESPTPRCPSPSTAKGDQLAPVRGTRGSDVSPHLGLQEVAAIAGCAHEGEGQGRQAPSQESHRGRIRRPPIWAGDYEMF